MALRQLILSRRVAEKQSALGKARAKLDEILEKRKALQVREGELEAAVKEITEETEDEIKAELDAAVAEFEAEVAVVEADQAAAEQEIVQIESEISDIQAELDELTAKIEGDENPPEPTIEPADDEARAERKVHTMNTRSIFGTPEQRSAFFAREDVKSYLGEIRAAIREKRAVSGAALTIPVVMLDLVRQEVAQASKLLPYVRVRNVGGQSRQNIAGAIPEGVWTDMCANIKLMTKALAFNSAAALVANTDFMPVLGGNVVEFDDDQIADNEIIGGFGGNYLLAERAGVEFASSDIPLFLQDQTVFKGTARYDGTPVAGEAFIVVNFANTDATTAADFPEDEANSVQAIKLNTATATVAAGGTVQLKAKTAPGKGTVTWTSGTEAKATVDSNGKVTGVSAGSSVITASCNGLTASCTVTVTSA